MFHDFTFLHYNPATRMSLELCILASGSSGSCSILRTPNGAALIDAGIGLRTFAKRADGAGLSLHDVRAICLTHLHSDHSSFRWLRTITARQLRVSLHARRATGL